MKISHYISILILACMSIGLLSSGFIYLQSSSIDQKQKELQLYSKDKTNCRNIDMKLSQWLTMLDLYLINKQTYLFKGLILEGNALINLTNEIKDNANDKLGGQLNEFKNKVKDVILIIKDCQKASSDSNLWNQALEKTDLITEGMDSPFNKANLFFNDRVQKKSTEIEYLQNAQAISAGFILFLLGIITLVTLRWANKSIISPLEKLSRVAEKEDLEPEDFKVKGPKEVQALSDKLGNYILALMKARKLALAEGELSKFANARIRNIMETAADAIVCADTNGNIIEMNQSFRHMAAINMNKYPSPKLSDLIPELELNQMDDIDSCKLISVIEATLYSKNKNEIPVEISTSSFSSGEDRLYTIIIRDVSDRTELMEQLLNAQKLESIGRLAAGIAHEINTPAQYIMDYNRFIKDGFENLIEFIELAHKLEIEALETFAEEKQLSFYEEEIPNAIKGSLFGLDQISKIVKSVKGFTHPQQSNKTVYNINDIINDTVNVSRNEWKYDADINVELDDRIPDFSCFPVRLNQVFLNLIVNSAQSIHEKKLKDESTEKGKINITTKVEDKNIIVSLEDTGTGIPDDIKNKVFDPFFTTKDVGVGTGQGLALSYDFIVNKHDGEISFDSQLGHGTKFMIKLPLTEEGVSVNKGTEINNSYAGVNS